MTTSTADDILARINRDIDAWDARPESWLPGDPLYTRPNGIELQTIRPMLQLIEDDELQIPMRCNDCQVSWAGAERCCWNCGVEGPESSASIFGETMQRMARHFAMAFDANVSRALADLAEYLPATEQPDDLPAQIERARAEVEHAQQAQRRLQRDLATQAYFVPAVQNPTAAITHGSAT